MTLEDDLRELIEQYEDEAATLRERAPEERCLETAMANVVELKIEELEELLDG